MDYEIENINSKDTENRDIMDILRNYTCDGQLAFDENGNIFEEKSEKPEKV